MKSTIIKILREQFEQDVEKNQTYNKILNDILKNFNRGNVQERIHGFDGDDFDLYSKTVEFATIIVGGYLEKTYGLISPQEDDLMSSLLIDWIGATYKDGNGVLPGDTIEMVEMVDDPNGIEPGTRGVVDDISSMRYDGNWEEHVEVKWENGRTLKVMLPYDKIKKIGKELNEETISGRDYKALPHVSDKQQKVLDYAVKDIVDNIEIRPETLTYEHIDDVMDDPYMDAAVVEIMNNWREMDSRGWRVGEGEEGSDGMVFSKKSDPSRYMNQWDAKVEIAVELMDELVEAGKFRRIGPEENEGRWGHVGWQSTYNDYDIIMLNRKGNR